MASKTERREQLRAKLTKPISTKKSLEVHRNAFGVSRTNFLLLLPCGLHIHSPRKKNPASVVTKGKNQNYHSWELPSCTNFNKAYRDWKVRELGTAAFWQVSMTSTYSMRNIKISIKDRSQDMKSKLIAPLYECEAQ